MEVDRVIWPAAGPLMNLRTTTYIGSFPAAETNRTCRVAVNNYSESANLIRSSFHHDVFSLLPYQVTVRRKSPFFQGKRQRNTNTRPPNNGGDVPFGKASPLYSFRASPSRNGVQANQYQCVKE